ncbi:MAG TPA: 2',3'-cyclic-nucleotide 2'-phosphodiesterase, partial [Pantoea sp.]|nr:2',3'-cyclic-nucleotide 2'-phosphodiesterase [Pantoea sp.]
DLETKKHGEIRPQADNNWRLAPIASPTPLYIRFETAPGDNATHFIQQHAQYPLQPKGTDAIGFALWQVNLQQ